MRGSSPAEVGELNLCAEVWIVLMYGLKYEISPLLSKTYDALYFDQCPVFEYCLEYCTMPLPSILPSILYDASYVYCTMPSTLTK